MPGLQTRSTQRTTGASPAGQGRGDTSQSTHNAAQSGVNGNPHNGSPHSVSAASENQSNGNTAYGHVPHAYHSQGYIINATRTPEEYINTNVIACNGTFELLAASNPRQRRSSSMEVHVGEDIEN